MDKISNRLRLVRSQSMGVGMGVSNDKISMAVAAARRTVHSQQNHVHGDVPNNQTSNTGVHGSNPGNPINNAGRNASVILLDERRLEMVIQPRLYAGELLDLIASHCQLKEKEFFGLGKFAARINETINGKYPGRNQISRFK